MTSIKSQMNLILESMRLVAKMIQFELIFIYFNVFIYFNTFYP